MEESVATMVVPTDVSCPGTSEIKDLFKSLAAEWEKKSYHMSNNVQMSMLKRYQRIIGMGWPAVRLILEEMKREPDQWFWALEAITGENPVPAEAAGDVLLKTQAWIDWGIRRGLVKPKQTPRTLKNFRD